MNKQIEIDILDSDSDGSADAIAIRYGDIDNNDFKVIIIDAGFKKTGENLVTLIENTYGTKKVDLAICTHSDQDHASGFPEILSGLNVVKMWLNLPWEHSEDLIDHAIDGRITINSLSEDFKKKYPYLNNIVVSAEENKTPLYQLNRNRIFDNGVLSVLSPTDTFYKELLKDSKKTKLASVTESQIETEKTLGGETEPENEMSGIILFEYADNKHLFTGDAGLRAFEEVFAYCDSNNINLDDLTMFQVPHHGSRKNIDKNVLDKIKAKFAYISASDKDKHHPHPLVIEALHEYSFEIYSTEGKNLLHTYNIQLRPNYFPAKKINP